ncbi:unnamed protein product [Clonostachys rosea]|uniref:Uncharacterized protein n=1 Tax=Bionectria ochroleuca TaxID=29856 RepID=A0ABY6U6E5_BIOOC|nr:unnamed protein product [Clonostachys rosea]
MRFSYIQTAILLSLSGLQQTTGAPLGPYSIQRGEKYGTSTVAYYIDERPTRGVNIEARGDKGKGQNPLSNKPSSSKPPSGKPAPAAGKPPTSAGKPSTPAGKPPTPAGKPPTPAGKPPTPAGKPPTPAGKPPAPAGKPPTPAGKPSDGVSKEAKGKRPNWEPKPLDFNPFNAKDPNYPYLLRQPEQTKTSNYDGVDYQMWDIIKDIKSADGKTHYVDQFGFANGGKNLVIKSAQNKGDPTINGKKASLAELLMAAYKYNSLGQLDPTKLEVIRIQDIQEEDTAGIMIEVQKAMKPEPEQPTNRQQGPRTRPPNISNADWVQLRRKLGNTSQRMPKSKPSPRVTEFDLSDTSNKKLYQDLKNSVWGQSVQRICTKFGGKQIVRIHVNMKEAQSFLIFYLG